MGMVWEALNERTGGQVALKLVRAGSDYEPELQSRLLREAKAAARIRHRNVVDVYDVGETEDGAPFLVMELLCGESLQERVERGPLTQIEAVNTTLAICSGLRAAHDKGVIHRDLKPANVFLHQEEDGVEVVKVLDFGVSKVDLRDDSELSVSGVAIGTPSYMSPEQARGERDLDARSDVWGLGVVLFQMLTGERPFDASTSVATIANILKSETPLLSEYVTDPPRGLTTLLYRCMQRDPDDRPEDIGQVIAALELERLELSGTESATRSLRACERDSDEAAPGKSPLGVGPAPTLQSEVRLETAAVDYKDSRATVVLPPLTRARSWRTRTLLLGAALMGLVTLSGVGLKRLGSPTPDPEETPRVGAKVAADRLTESRSDWVAESPPAASGEGEAAAILAKPSPIPAEVARSSEHPATRVTEEPSENATWSGNERAARRAPGPAAKRRGHQQKKRPNKNAESAARPPEIDCPLGSLSMECFGEIDD